MTDTKESRMSTEIARIESRIPRKAEITDLGLLANHLAHSGLFKDARGGAQAFAKLLFGRDLGLSATAAMTGVHIIEGKPEIGANLQAQMVKTYSGPEGERYDYHVLAHTNERCRIEFRRRERGGDWEVLGESEYTLQDAQTAQLAGKGNWKKHPRNMLFARAMSDGVAFHCPEVTNGIRTYHEGEIDVDGSARDIAPAPAPDVVLDGEIVDGEVLVEQAEAIAGPTVHADPPQPTEPLITAPQVRLLHARCGEIGLDDQTRRALIHCVSGQPHSDRVPKRLLGNDGAKDGEARSGLLGVIAAAKEAQVTPEVLHGALREEYGERGGPTGVDVSALIARIHDAAVPF